MLAAVELDDQMRLEAGEVGDEGADGMLPAETEAAKLATAEVEPEPDFGIGLGAAEISGDAGFRVLAQGCGSLMES